MCRCGFRLPSGAGRVGSKCPPYLSGVFCAAWERQPENFGFLVFRLPFCLSQRCSVRWGVCRCGFRLPSGVGRVGSECPPYLSGCSARRGKGSLKTLVSWFSGCLFVYHNAVFRVMGRMPMRFQAAFGRGTRGQRVLTLPVGMFCTAWKRQPENFGLLVFRLPFCLSQRCSVRWGVCRCGFRLPSGVGRVGSGCPPYLSGVFCVARERQPENFVSWFSGCLVLRRNGLQAVCFFVFFFYEHAHVVNFRYCFV